MSVRLLSPAPGAVMNLQTAAQKAFLDGEAVRAQLAPDNNIRWFAPEKSGQEFSRPAGILFSWEDTEAGTRAYVLRLSESPDLSDAWVLTAQGTSLPVFNFKVNTTYYATVETADGSARSAVLCFRTANTLPRTLRVPDISNVRDLGGYAVPGGVVRQGLLLRGGELEAHMTLTPEGEQALGRLGIRTELDMREEAVGLAFSAAEACGIERISVPVPAYADMLRAMYADACRRFFAVLGEPERYPIYFHCWGGADRTGTAAFLLGALLGLTEAQLVNDYEFTGLSVWGTRSRNSDRFADFLDGFRDLPGATLREKAAYYFHEMLGLPDAWENTVRRVLIKEG